MTMPPHVCVCATFIFKLWAVKDGRRQPLWCFPNPIMTQVEAGRKKGTGCGHTSCLGKYQRVCGSEWGVKANSITSLPITTKSLLIQASTFPVGKRLWMRQLEWRGVGVEGECVWLGSGWWSMVHVGLEDPNTSALHLLHRSKKPLILSHCHLRHSLYLHAAQCPSCLDPPFNPAFPPFLSGSLCADRGCV